MMFIKDYWNKHGTKVMGTLTTLFGSLQGAITLGLMEVTKGVKNVIALALIALGTFTVKRSIGSPPKSPEPPKS